MNIDLDESKILTALCAAFIGAVMWIYNLGGKVKTYEMDIESTKKDVRSINDKIDRAVAERHESDKRLERIDTNQQHMTRAMDQIANKLGGHA